MIGRRIGRPRKEPPPDAAKRIRELSAGGHSIRGICMELGVDVEPFQRWMKEYPVLKEAFEDGRERERKSLHNVLYVQATEKGNIVAAMFLLKTRHGYREGDQGESGNRININFTLPGALKPEAFKVIDNGAADSQALALPRARAPGT